MICKKVFGKCFKGKNHLLLIMLKLSWKSDENPFNFGLNWKYLLNHLEN